MTIINRRIKRNQVVDETADVFLKHVKEQVESAEVKTAIALIKHTDGTIYYITTESDYDELAGILEVGKNTLLNG